MKYLLLLSLAFFVGCGANNAAISAKDNAQGDALAYLQKIRGYPNTFTLPNADAEAAWGRAQVFVSKYSTMKIQTVSDYIVETYNTRTLTGNDVGFTGIKCDFAYSFTRSPGKDSTTFTVGCRTNCGGLGDARMCAADNEKFASYFVQTGENIKYPEFIAN